MIDWKETHLPYVVDGGPIARFRRRSRIATIIKRSKRGP